MRHTIPARPEQVHLQSSLCKRRTSGWSLAELCPLVGDYRTLAEAAREQGDAEHFMAGLLAAGK